MYRIKRFVVILFVIIFHTTVFAGDITDTIALPRVFIFETKEFENETEGEPFFLCSNLIFNERHNGNIYLFFSNAEINAELDGKIYAFFSNTRVNDGGSVEEGVYYFYSELSIDNDSDTDVLGSLWLDWISLSHTRGSFTYYSNKMPLLLQNLFFVVVKILLLLVICSVRKSFFVQGCGVCWSDGIQVVKKGVAFYFTALCVGVIFFVSIVGFPVVLLIILILVVMLLVGEVSLCMCLGNYITKRFRLPFAVFSYANVIIGAIIVESIVFIPFVSWAVFYLLLPVATTGIVCETVMNAFVYKKFYTPEEYAAVRTVVNKNIRDMLMDKL